MAYKHILTAFNDAFPHTIPIMLGYVFMGAAFGILLSQAGFGVWFAIAMAIIIYGGTTQFVSVGLLSSGAGLWESFVIASMVNARQIFYGISMLSPFRAMDKRRFYMIYSLTDETLALLHLKKAKDGIDKQWFAFFIAFLNQMYWIVGCAIGAIIGSNITFNTNGLDFVMNAIFVVIFIEQWQHKAIRPSAIIGFATSLACLIVFGKEQFLLPSLIGMCIILLIFQNPLNTYIDKIDTKENRHKTI